MRINYIDNLKGIAIILVVMGHVEQFSLGLEDNLFRTFYNGFHMPLFMFLSGVFAMKSFKLWNLSESLLFLKKKVLRILLPFLVIGGTFYTITNGNPLGILGLNGEAAYWFLPALFYCMVVGWATFMIYHKATTYLCGDKRYWFVEFSFVFIGYMVLLSMSHFFPLVVSQVPYFYKFVAMYPYFMLGTDFFQYKSIRNNMEQNTHIMTVAIIVYILSWVFFDNLYIPISLMVVSAITILINLFSSIDIRGKYLASLGRHSLEIYVLHSFFMIGLASVGVWIEEQTMPVSWLPNNDNVLLIIVTSSIIAIPVILMCLVCGKIAKRSRLFTMFLGGC